MMPYEVLRLADGASSYSISGLYVVVAKNATQSIVAGQKVAFDTVDQGNASMFDNANDSVLSPVTGLVRARGSIRHYAGMSGGAGIYQMQRNGSTTYSAKGTSDPVVHNSFFQAFFTGIQSVNIGDAFSILGAGTGTMGGMASGDYENWLALEVLPSDHRYSLATLAADTSTIAVDTVFDVPFDTDLHDPEGIHDPVSNRHRFVVPAGGPHLCRFRTQLRVASSGGSGELWIFSRYSSTTGGALGPVDGGIYHQTQGANRDHYVCGASAILSLASGAVLGVGLLSGSGATAVVKGTQNTWGELEILDPATKYTLTRSAVTQTAVGAGGRKTFPTTMANTAGATIPGDGRIIAPAGFTRARVSFNLVGPTDNAPFNAWGQLNGFYRPGMPDGSSNTAFGDSINGEGAWFDINPAGGDVFDVRVSATVTKDYSGGPEVWFQVEFA